MGLLTQCRLIFFHTHILFRWCLKSRGVHLRIGCHTYQCHQGYNHFVDHCHCCHHLYFNHCCYLLQLPAPLPFSTSLLAFTDCPGAGAINRLIITTEEQGRRTSFSVPLRFQGAVYHSQVLPKWQQLKIMLVLGNSKGRLPFAAYCAKLNTQFTLPQQNTEPVIYGGVAPL